MEQLLSKYQNILAGVLVALILAYGSYTYIYKPKIKEIDNLKSSLQMINNEIKSIPGGDQFLKDIPGAKAALKKENDELSNKIPPETSSPYLINNFISAVGKGLNIDYNLIQPGAIVQEQKYKRLPLNLDFESPYADLNAYLLQLKGLPVTIRVDKLGVHKLAGTRKLSVQMSLSAFVMPGGAPKPEGVVKGYSSLFDPFFAQRISKVAAKGGTAVPRTGLQGIKYSGYWMDKDMFAIINDESVKAGQSIMGYQVQRIYKDRVVLRKNGKQYELPLENK